MAVIFFVQVLRDRNSATHLTIPCGRGRRRSLAGLLRRISCRWPFCPVSISGEYGHMIMSAALLPRSVLGALHTPLPSSSASRRLFIWVPVSHRSGLFVWIDVCSLHVLILGCSSLRRRPFRVFRYAPVCIARPRPHVKVFPCPLVRYAYGVLTAGSSDGLFNGVTATFSVTRIVRARTMVR